MPAHASTAPHPLFSPRQRRWAVLLLALWFLLCLLWLAPASLFTLLLRDTLPALQLHTVTGSFWHGEAAQASWQLPEAGGQQLALGRFEWQLRPWSLLLLQPRIQLHTSLDRQFLDGELRLSPLGSIELRETRAAVPLSALRGWLPLPADGLLTLQLQRLRLGEDGSPRGAAGTLQWQQAAWQWENRWQPLGDYRWQFAGGEEEKLTGEISGGEAVIANGTVLIDSRAHEWSVEGSLKPTATLPPALRDGLGLLLSGVRQDDGSWRIQQRGHW